MFLTKYSNVYQSLSSFSFSPFTRSLIRKNRKWEVISLIRQNTKITASFSLFFQANNFKTQKGCTAIQMEMNECRIFSTRFKVFFPFVMKYCGSSTGNTFSPVKFGRLVFPHSRVKIPFFFMTIFLSIFSSLFLPFVIPKKQDIIRKRVRWETKGFWRISHGIP